MLPPEDKFRHHDVRVTRRYPAVEIHVRGDRDPRGDDNNVLIWLDGDDKLHILVHKAERCYKFKEMVNGPGWVEIIQE